MLCFIIVLVFSMLASSTVYQNIYSKSINKKISEISLQTLSSINLNLELLVENLNEYSKMVLTNDNIRSSINTTGTNLAYRRQINEYFAKFILPIANISSIYFFDIHGNIFQFDKTQPNKAVTIEKISDAPWYNELIFKKGGYMLALNGGNIFRTTSASNFVSLLRVVNDFETQVPIGILMINTPETAIQKSFIDINYQYDTKILIKDENGENIIGKDINSNSDIDAFIERSRNKQYSYTEMKVDGKLKLISYLESNNLKWKIISIMSLENLTKESMMLNVTTYVIIIVNSLVIFLFSIFISRIIITPANKLLKAMKSVEKGEFNEVELDGNNEFGKLRDGYNIMIKEIKKLIERIMEEQRLKRKIELNILQDQVKPHFLYNTFDSISSLALSGRTDDVYTVMKALGRFYRTSLSKGKEVVTIEEEINTLKNYLIIQNIRYNGLFTIFYDIDESAGKYKILRLTLQPLVENSLHHGMKNYTEHGTISISAKLLADCVRIEIEDDGIGIEKEYLKSILNRNLNDESSSFGLRGTIERLRIFYGIDNVVEIDSEPGRGTKIIINIPKQEEYDGD